MVDVGWSETFRTMECILGKQNPMRLYKWFYVGTTNHRTLTQLTMNDQVADKIFVTNKMFDQTNGLMVSVALPHWCRWGAAKPALPCSYMSLGWALGIAPRDAWKRFAIDRMLSLRRKDHCRNSIRIQVDTLESAEGHALAAVPNPQCRVSPRKSNRSSKQTWSCNGGNASFAWALPETLVAWWQVNPTATLAREYDSDPQVFYM